jgi:hypothetical protein
MVPDNKYRRPPHPFESRTDRIFWDFSKHPQGRPGEQWSSTSQYWTSKPSDKDTLSLGNEWAAQGYLEVQL